MASDIEEQTRLNEVENSEHDNDKEARIIAELKDKDLLSRKRSQTEMEPAVRYKILLIVSAIYL